MFVAELTFEVSKEQGPDPANVSDAVNRLLGSLRMNGQICGREWPIVQLPSACRATVLIPDRDALDTTYHNQYVLDAIRNLTNAGLGSPQIAILGRDIDGDSICTCASPTAYILFTNYLSLEPPLKCADCFHSVPLYRIPRPPEDDYYPVIVWQSDYQACDSLQMNCTTLERAATLKLSRADSSLSRQGRDVCCIITEQTGKPVYYYLYRYGGRSRAQECKRRCPSCGGIWLLDTPWHDRFDFRCDTCRLLSNIAWNVR